MFMKRRTGIALVIAGLVAGLALGSYGIATAVTASSSTTQTAGMPSGPGGGPGHGRGGAMGSADLAQAVSKLTGISVTEVRTQRAASKSYAAIAATKGVSASAVVDKAVADAKTPMDAQVKIGQMTSAQETQFLADLKTRLTTEVSWTTAMPAAQAGGKGLGAPGVGGLASAVASLTATTVDDVMAQRAAGKSFAEIASAKGVSADAVIERALAAATAELKTRFTSEINDTGTVGPGGGGPGGPGGPGGGF